MKYDTKKIKVVHVYSTGTGSSYIESMEHGTKQLKLLKEVTFLKRYGV